MIRQKAPQFSKQAVVSGAIEQISLDQFKGQWVVLVFVPLAFTFVCPTEIVAFSRAAPKFSNRNAVVLVCSTDSEFSLLSWNRLATSHGGLGGAAVPLLSDKNLSMSRDYGVLLPEGIALRGTFLIDPEQVVVHKQVNDTPVGRSVDECLRVLDGFQFLSEHGEMANKC